jgi:hypothetical protein
VIAGTNQPVWSNWAGTNGEDVTDLSIWDAPVGENFLLSLPLSPVTQMLTSDSLGLASAVLSLVPVAA